MILRVCLGHQLEHHLGHVWGKIWGMSGASYGASSGACLGHQLGHVWHIIWACLGHHLGHVWSIIWGIIRGIIWGISGTSSVACLGQHLGNIVNNGQQSAVLHASVMPFFTIVPQQNSSKQLKHNCSQLMQPMGAYQSLKTSFRFSY